MNPPLPSPGRLEAALDRVHARARSNPWLYRFAIVIRILLAGAFLPTGLVKFLGHRFTQIGPEDPIGRFFEALYQAGGYWRFIGAVQILASLLLLAPRTATLGAVLFFPVALNIFVITVALHFTGTPFITGPMLLAALYLLCWDYDRLKGVLWPTPYAGTVVPATPGYALRPLERVACVLGTAGLLSMTAAVRGFVPFGLVPAAVQASLGMIVLGVVVALVSLPGTLRARRT